MRILRENKDSLMSVLEAFVHDPLVEWEADKAKIVSLPCLSGAISLPMLISRSHTSIFSLAGPDPEGQAEVERAQVETASRPGRGRGSADDRVARVQGARPDRAQAEGGPGRVCRARGADPDQGDLGREPGRGCHPGGDQQAQPRQALHRVGVAYLVRREGGKDLMGYHVSSHVSDLGWLSGRVRPGIVRSLDSPVTASSSSVGPAGRLFPLNRSHAAIGLGRTALAPGHCLADGPRGFNRLLSS